MGERQQLIIGLTGKREAGKSSVAKVLLNHGFVVGHPFNPGKAATVGYFKYLGMPDDLVEASVYGTGPLGNLKDVPNPYLPNNELPRTWMERFGQWIPQVMGLEWTIGVEMRHLAAEHPGRDVVVESMVYEADIFRSLGGLIVRVVRPGHAHPTGERSDAAQAQIEADFFLCNKGSLADLDAEVLRVTNAARNAAAAGILALPRTPHACLDDMQGFANAVAST